MLLLYHDYLDLKKKHGAEAAKQQFRLSCLHIAEEEGLTEVSQCRKLDTYGVFFGRV